MPRQARLNAPGIFNMTAAQRSVQVIFASIVSLLAACATTRGLTPVTDPAKRIEFNGFSILPPRGEGWFRLEPPPQVEPNLIAKVYFIKRLTEEATSPSELHRLTAVVRTLNLGDVRIENPIDLLKGMAGGFSGKSFLDKCFGGDCVRYQSTSKDLSNPQFPGYAFVISKQGFVVFHPESPTLAINVEYRQYYGRGVQRLSEEVLEREVEPFQESLEFTAARPAAESPTPVRWAFQLVAGFEAANWQRWPEAEASFKAALDDAERLFGPEDLRLARTLYSLALVHIHQERQDEAEPLYRRALAIYEQRPGADQQIYGQTLSDLGTLYMVQGRYDQAEPMLKRSLTVRESALGPNHRDVGQSLYNLMDLYARWDRWAEAEPFARRALPVYERAKGRESRWLGWILHTLGWIHEKQGAPADAEPFFKRGLAITEKALGKDDSEVAHQLAHQLEDYSIILRKVGRQQEAEELEAQARAIRGRPSGDR